MRMLLASAVIALVSFQGAANQDRTPKGIRLETQTWVEAQEVLKPDAVIVIPIGAALKEHGPHLKLRNDLTLAEHFTDRILASSRVVVTPPLTYHFYPAFLDYPGSTSLSLDTAREMTEQIVRSIARHGPRRFYALNTGISTLRPLQAAANTMAAEGILLRFTNFGAAIDEVSSKVRQQEGGSHADEIETSMLLHIAPSSVDMRLAARDLGPASTPMRLTRRQGTPGTYSPTGIWGDATLATASKGKIVVDGVVEKMLQDIEALRAATPPAPQPAAAPTPPPAAAAPPRPSPPTAAPTPAGCLPGDERTIRKMADEYNHAWATMYAQGVASLWAADGDIVHPDASTERGRIAIQQNRTEQFMRKEFSGSKHALTFGNVRCLTADVAVVDGKWELRGARDRTGNPIPRAEGLLTVVMKRDGGWQFQAFRYTVTQQAATPPTLLKKPGYPEVIK